MGMIQEGPVRAPGELKSRTDAHRTLLMYMLGSPDVLGRWMGRWEIENELCGGQGVESLCRFRIRDPGASGYWRPVLS